MENKETALDLLEGSESKVVSKLLLASKENYLTWYSNKDSQEKLAEEVNLSVARIKQILKSLLTKGIIHQKTRGVYVMSAKYFSVTKKD